MGQINGRGPISKGAKMFEAQFARINKWIFLDYRATEAQAKARCTSHLKRFGHPQKYRIEKDGAAWLEGVSIVIPKMFGDEARIEWRQRYEVS
jgi:hypothetical protein